MNVSEVNQLLSASEAIDNYLEISNEVYHACDAMGHSGLRGLRDSPSKYLWNKDNRSQKYSKALDLGAMIHMAVLEPELFEKTHAKMPKFDMRTKVGKAGAADWEQSNKDRVGVKPNDWEMIEKIYESLHHDPFLSKFVGKGLKEKSFFHKDEETGVWLKCRPDNFLIEDGVIIDLKTTESALPWKFNQSIQEYGYDTQAAFYCDVIGKSIGIETDFIIVAVEKEKDNDVNIFYFDREDRKIASNIYRDWLTKYAKCKQTNVYPGYERKFIKAIMPEWKKRMYGGVESE